MKLRTIKFLTLAALVAACSYEFPEQDPATVPSKGNADFSKTVVVGSSLSAGFMNGALYTDGQKYSFPSILARQFAEVEGGEFHQPDINAVNGYYGLAPDGTTVLGRLYLKYSADKCNPETMSPAPAPKIPGNAITAYAGDKSSLNNFSAYGISILTADLAATGGPASGNPYYNPYYARFASAPGTSTLLSDAEKAMETGTFLIFWLGNDDVLGYALNGADQNDATKPMTSVAAFTPTYNNVLNTLLEANEGIKGAVANIPNVTSLPHFFIVKHNVIVLKNQEQVDGINGGFATYNGGLAAAQSDGAISEEEKTRRTINFTVSCTNRIVIEDESLTEVPGLPKLRQAEATDLITLAAGSILGTTVGGDPSKVNGVTVPLADKYVLIPTETEAINQRIEELNTAISNAVAAHADDLVLVDVNNILKTLIESPTGVVVNGLALTSSIVPPSGGFSLDGIHPNARGNAYLANKFIEAINAKFQANIPLANPNDYPGNDLPVQ